MTIGVLGPRFFFQAEDGIRDTSVTGVQTCALPILQGGFRSFAGGMGEITEALAARLGPIIRTSQGVTGIAPTARGWRLAVTEIGRASCRERVENGEVRR